jgi:hypothetical protein
MSNLRIRRKPIRTRRRATRQSRQMAIQNRSVHKCVAGGSPPATLLHLGMVEFGAQVRLMGDVAGHSSLKHAFADDAASGLISVTYERTDMDWRLTVSDNGMGKPRGQRVRMYRGWAQALSTPLPSSFALKSTS